MDKYMIKEQDKTDIENSVKSIRKLLKERRTLEINHKLNKISDILMNLRKIL